MWRAWNLTMSCWSNGLSVCFPSQGTQVQNPWGYLCETGILLLALSRYIGDPEVIDHFCCLVWGGLSPEPSLGPHADNVIIPVDLTQLSCPGFTLAAGPPSSFTTDGVGCWGEPCGEPAISPCLTGPVEYLFASRHKGPGFKTPGGTCVKPGFSCKQCLASIMYVCVFYIYIYLSVCMDLYMCVYIQ